MEQNFRPNTRILIFDSFSFSFFQIIHTWQEYRPLFSFSKLVKLICFLGYRPPCTLRRKFCAHRKNKTAIRFFFFVADPFSSEGAGRAAWLNIKKSFKQVLNFWKILSYVSIFLPKVVAPKCHIILKNIEIGRSDPELRFWNFAHFFDNKF